MFKNATIAERDSILLNRAVASGMLSTDAASYLCKIDSYLFRGMLADVSGRDLDDRSSYRVKIVSVSTGSTQQRKEKVTA